jgi:hypothetical protein
MGQFSKFSLSWVVFLIIEQARGKVSKGFYETVPHEQQGQSRIEFFTNNCEEVKTKIVLLTRQQHVYILVDRYPYRSYSLRRIPMPNESIEQDTLDLISLNDAVTLSKKGKSTIRRWRREGLLTKYQMNKDKKNSPIAIDKNELLIFLGTVGQSIQNHVRPTPLEKTVSIDRLKKELLQLENNQKLSQEREVVYIQTINETRLSTERLNNQVNMLSELLKSAQEDLRLATQQIAEQTSRNEKLSVAAALYQAECEKGFFGRLFTKPISILQLPGPTQ